MVTYVALNHFWPIKNAYGVDDDDYFGTFQEKPHGDLEGVDGVSSAEGSFAEPIIVENQKE